MAYVFADAASLCKLPGGGTRQCIALTTEYTKASLTSTWTKGTAVNGDLVLKNPSNNGGALSAIG